MESHWKVRNWYVEPLRRKLNEKTTEIESCQWLLNEKLVKICSEYWFSAVQKITPNCWPRPETRDPQLVDHFNHFLFLWTTIIRYQCTVKHVHLSLNNCILILCKQKMKQKLYFQNLSCVIEHHQIIVWLFVKHMRLSVYSTDFIAFCKTASILQNVQVAVISKVKINM